MTSVEFDSIKSDKTIRAAIQKAVKTALEGMNADLSVVVCDDDFIHSLNKQYRDVDRPTDVLSFESNEIDPESDTRYLGDIIISLPRATSQAEEANHPVSEEISMLAIHGVLHLLGFDHHSPDEKNIMWVKQRELLHSLGIEMDSFSGDE